jgi:glycosyltransferase involved in cell wall biosynthesis
VDVDLYRPSGQPPEPPPSKPVVLYTGSMDYPPNADAVTWFARAIWPAIQGQHPAARFLIVGRNPGSEVQALTTIPGISVTGTVPDVRPYFEQAKVYVVPLRSGSGTRLKILEAMAMGLPIVSTTLGFEGLDVRPGRDLLVADEPASFASAVVGLLADREARARLGIEARQTAEQRYSWDAVVRQQERAYELAVARQS